MVGFSGLGVAYPTFEPLTTPPDSLSIRDSRMQSTQELFTSVREEQAIQLAIASLLAMDSSDG